MFNEYTITKEGLNIIKTMTSNIIQLESIILELHKNLQNCIVKEWQDYNSFNGFSMPSKNGIYLVKQCNGPETFIWVREWSDYKWLNLKEEKYGSVVQFAAING